jgi:hypothetical protein
MATGVERTLLELAFLVVLVAPVLEPTPSRCRSVEGYTDKWFR